MARMIHRLSALKVARAKTGFHPDGGNLYLQVSDTGARSWIFRYRSGGRQRYHGLGSLITIGLAEARERSLQCRRQLLDGIDPIEARKTRRGSSLAEAAKAMTFEQAASGYIASHKATWGNRHRDQFINSLQADAYPIIGPLPVAAIDTPLVLRVLEPIWQKKPETAARVRRRIQAILDWATARGLRSGDNPARWAGHLDHILPSRFKVAKVEHLEALPFVELRGFIAELRKHKSTAAAALEFAILTAARTGEVLGALWNEIDLDGKVWTIPAARMKADRDHRVPLAPAAVAILRRMKEVRQNDTVFPGRGRSGQLNAMAMRVILAGIRRGCTVHGFRSSFRDWASERTNYPREVAEMALAHSIGDAVEAAYRRGDLFGKRARLMDAWSDYCGGESAGQVLPMKRPA